MSDDIVEQMARASYEAEVNRWPQYASGFQKWEDVGPETKERFRNASRAAYAIARRAVLEEAAKLIEQRTARQRTLFALQNGLREAQSCEHADAIRKLAGEA